MAKARIFCIEVSLVEMLKCYILVWRKIGGGSAAHMASFSRLLCMASENHTRLD